MTRRHWRLGCSVSHVGWTCWVLVEGVMWVPRLLLRPELEESA